MCVCYDTGFENSKPRPLVIVVYPLFISMHSYYSNTNSIRMGEDSCKYR